MTDSNYKCVFTGNFAQVQLIISQLEEIGINAIVKDEGESARLAAFAAPGAMQQLFVHNDELDKAVPLIQEISSAF